MRLELSAVVSLGLAAVAIYVQELPPTWARVAGARSRRYRRPGEAVPTPDQTAGKGAAGRIAWGGFALATAAIFGYAVAPRAEIAWLVMLAVAIASVPVAAAVSLVRRPVREDEKGDFEEPGG